MQLSLNLLVNCSGCAAISVCRLIRTKRAAEVGIFEALVTALTVKLNLSSYRSVRSVVFHHSCFHN